MVVREDNSEEIAENIEGNLEEDVKSSTSREEEIPQEEEDNLMKAQVKMRKCTHGTSLSTKRTMFALSVMKVLKDKCE